MIEDDDQEVDVLEAATTQPHGWLEHEAMVGTLGSGSSDRESDDGQATPTPSLLPEGRSFLRSVQQATAHPHEQTGSQMGKPVHKH